MIKAFASILLASPIAFGKVQEMTVQRPPQEVFTQEDFNIVNMYDASTPEGKEMVEIYRLAEELYHEKKTNRNIIFTQLDYIQEADIAYQDAKIKLPNQLIFGGEHLRPLSFKREESESLNEAAQRFVDLIRMKTGDSLFEIDCSGISKLQDHQTKLQQDVLNPFMVWFGHGLDLFGGEYMEATLAFNQDRDLFQPGSMLAYDFYYSESDECAKKYDIDTKKGPVIALFIEANKKPVTLQQSEKKKFNFANVMKFLSTSIIEIEPRWNKRIKTMIDEFQYAALIFLSEDAPEIDWRLITFLQVGELIKGKETRVVTLMASKSESATPFDDRVPPLTSIVNLPTEDVQLPWVFLYHKATEQIAVYPFEWNEQTDSSMLMLLSWAQLASLELEITHLTMLIEDIAVNEDPDAEVYERLKFYEEQIKILTKESDTWALELEQIIELQQTAKENVEKKVRDQSKRADDADNKKQSDEDDTFVSEDF